MWDYKEGNSRHTIEFLQTLERVVHASSNLYLVTTDVVFMSGAGRGLWQDDHEKGRLSSWALGPFLQKDGLLIRYEKKLSVEEVSIMEDDECHPGCNFDLLSGRKLL